MILLVGCHRAAQLNRFYYLADEPIEVYEFPSFSGSPILTIQKRDTISATGKETVHMGGFTPIEYKGYGFYSPFARASFLSKTKVDPKQEPVIPAVAYVARQKQKVEDEQTKQVEADTKQYWAEQDKIEWYGQVSYRTQLLSDMYAVADTVLSLPANTIVKIKQHNYSYWKVWHNGKQGYLPVHFIYYFSKARSPFVATEYTGRTYHPDGEEYHQRRINTPTTGATLNVGPRGGVYYYNSHGNKTYIHKK
ncbi:hypothetical protein [Spirosoma koreense]